MAEILELLTITLKEINITKQSVITYIYFTLEDGQVTEFTLWFQTRVLYLQSSSRCSGIGTIGKNKAWKVYIKGRPREEVGKYRPWKGVTDDGDNSSRHRLDSLYPSMTSDSGPWLSTPEFEFKPKLFNDPRSTSSDKENMPPLQPIPMPVLNIEESDFIERTEKLLEKDNNGKSM